VPSTYPITSLDGISADDAAELRKAGIRTTTAFLEMAKSPKGRADLAKQTGIDQRRLLRWANVADFLRVSGLGRGYVELLNNVGVDTVRDLRYRNPAHLAERMADTNKKKKLVRLVPTEKAIGRWIAHARKLPLKITYRNKAKPDA
jgi:predicted RecB family nuclease